MTSLGLYAAERKNWNIWIKKESSVGCPSVLGRSGGHGTQRNQKWAYSRQGEAGVMNRQGVMSLWETLSTQQRKVRHGQTPEKRKKTHRFDLANLTKGKRKIWAQPEVENNMINTQESADLSAVSGSSISWNTALALKQSQFSQLEVQGCKKCLLRKCREISWCGEE